MRLAISVALSLALGLTACTKGARATSAAVSAAAAKNPASPFDGEVLYVNNCSSCHQVDGRGVPGAFPPLAQNPAVTGNPVAVIAIVKNGLEGKIVVNGETYSGIMPRWNGLLSDEQVASVVSYIRSSWENHASGVSLSDVQAVK
jgi:nitrite reductase (NO-forming) / hydroxylamine reductase